MKKYIIIFFIGICNISYAQGSLINFLDINDVKLNSKSIAVLNQYKSNAMINNVTLIKVDQNVLLKSNKIDLKINNQRTTATLAEIDYRDNGDFSWFGKVTDETGIFFTVMNNQVASKFYIDDKPYTIIPLIDDIHMLLEFNGYIYAGECGLKITKSDIDPKDIHPYDNVVVPPINSTRGPDDNCRMRVLFVVTTQAEADISMDLNLAARMLEDETNLSYMNSLINTRMEIARVIRTTYTELTTNTTSTEYGTSSSFPTDLINLRSGTGLLSNIPTLRNTYAADIVVMVRSIASFGTSLFGVALGVPVDPFTLNANNGFAIISTNFMIGGRHTFAHEIGHIQGARHDNHVASPDIAKGFVFNAGSTTGRTIMATSNVSACAAPSTGCRINNFSNPNVSVGGFATGTSTQNNNALRINQTSVDYLNFRTTTTNLLLSAETFDNESLARHVATQTISTNNSAVVAQSGSIVSMRAGKSVTMLPGFRADFGSRFVGYIDNCTNAPIFKTVSEHSSNTNKNLSIFPNPTNGHINVYLDFSPQHTNYFIHSIDGKLVLKGAFIDKINSIDMTSLLSGIYYITINENDKKIIAQKIVKE